MHTPGTPAFRLKYLPIASFCLQTADAWASKGQDAGQAAQCLVPGYNYPSFPYTADQKNVCQGKVVTLDLVNKDDITQKVGRVYAFKDLSDNLLVTVSLNATFYAKSNPSTDFKGQYLHAQPALSGSAPAGRIWVWDEVSQLFNEPNAYAYTNMLDSDNSQG